MRVIDAHVHITEDGKWFHTDYDASVEKLLINLEESKIDKAVILPIAPFISNEFVAKVCSQYPDKFIGFVSVYPNDKNALNELEKSVINYGLKGLKLHPKFQGFKLNEPNVELVIKKAAELKIPVLIDAWVRPQDTEYQDLISSIAQVAKKIPSAKIILAHLGGFNYNEIPQIARENNNIYFDLSFILTHFNRDVIYNHIIPVIKYVDANRLIYGSDYPEIDVETYLKSTREIFNNMGFKLEEKRYIFRKTIGSLLK